MREKILNAIRKNEIETYLITETVTEGAELYFIRKELDMRRMKKETSAEVAVYRDFEEDGKKMRGASTVHIFPEMTQEETDKVIAEAYYAASFVKNPFFELASGKKEEKVFAESRLLKKSAEEIADAFVSALYAADVKEDAFINTSEFFVNKYQVAICNSEGVDVSYEKMKVNGEFVVQCLAPQDVEQYQDFSYADFDTEALTAQAKEALDMVRARARATEAPEKGSYTVIISGKEMRDLMELYTMRAMTNMIYPGYSNYKKGTKVQGEKVSGEKLNLTLKATTPYSEEGIPMKDMVLVQDGELQAIYGGVRFSRYMGVEPTGTYEAVKVDNGTVSFADMKKQPYLHVVSFSGFSMDSFSGYFGGEIRLAYLYDGEKVTPVTGGSINGNLLELQKNMVFSTDRYKNDRYDGPMAVRFEHVAVAGK